jgi:glutamate/aspartate transport system permease protein
MGPFLDDVWIVARAIVELNVRMTISAIGIALPIGCLFAVGRLSRLRFVYYPITAYVNVLRSSPLLMIMFWAYYTGPMITGHPSSAYGSAMLALAAFEIAYFTEIIRAGLQSVSIGQRRAGLASGLTPAQTMRLIVMPQGLRRMLPSLLSQSIIAFQDSTIASVLGVSEALHVTTIVVAREQRTIELYSVLALLFLVICYSASRLVRYLEARMLARLGTASG